MGEPLIAAWRFSMTQLADPPQAIARAMAADASLQSMCIDFESSLTEALGILVRGTRRTR